MARHEVPTRWKSGMLEVGPRVFAYVQASGIDPVGATGVSNAGLILGHEGNVLVDALMVPSMTRRLVAAIKKTTRKPIATLVNTHHHLDHTGGNRFFRGATMIASEKCREALEPGFPPVPLLQRFMPRFAREFPLLELVLPTVTFEDRLVLHDGERELHLWHPGTPAHTSGDALVYLPRERLIFAGDLAFHYVTPLAFQGHVGQWIAAADRVLAFEADVIVPGHRPIGTPKALTSVLALNRTVGVVLISVLFFGLGEQLWNPFFPAYLQAKLGPGAANQGAMAGVNIAALFAVGIYACLRNLFEAFCYVGGGQLTARLGDRGSLIVFGVLTIGGYALFLVDGGPVVAIVATLLIVGWEPLSVPVTFTTVGATVTTSSQGMAFAVQSIQKRLPKIVGPLVAGFVLAAAAAHYGSREIGYVVGMRWLVAVSLLLGLASLGLQLRWMPHHEPPPPGPGARAVVRQFPPPLRRLLLAE